MSLEQNATKIRNAYNGDHDTDPDTAPVTWREMLLLEMIELLAQRIEDLENDEGSIAETIRRNADARIYQR